jgi:hypothetical protein
MFKLILQAILLLVFLGANAQANVPASYFACEGLDDGFRCRMTGPFFGRCTLDTLCEEDPDNVSLQSINECLLCVDECWSRELGAQCIIARTGDRGVCTQIPDCTPDLEKSFRQCQRCQDGELTWSEPQDGCHASSSLPRTCIWLGILCLAWLNITRASKRTQG